MNLTSVAMRIFESGRSLYIKVFNIAEVSERVIEYAFVVKHLKNLSGGKVLDVGCTNPGNCLSTILAAMGFDVYGIDLHEFKVRYSKLNFSIQDIRATSFPDQFFDRIIAVSTIEHIGLGGRYGITESDPEGDKKAIKEMLRILKPDGKLLVTVPYTNKFTVMASLARFYDRQRLRDYLFDNLLIEAEEYAVIDEKGYWATCTELRASEVDVSKSGGFNSAIAMFQVSRR